MLNFDYEEFMGRNEDLIDKIMDRSQGANELFEAIEAMDLSHIDKINVLDHIYENHKTPLIRRAVSIAEEEILYLHSMEETLKSGVEAEILTKAQASLSHRNHHIVCYAISMIEKVLSDNPDELYNKLWSVFQRPNFPNEYEISSAVCVTIQNAFEKQDRMQDFYSLLLDLPQPEEESSN